MQIEKYKENGQRGNLVLYKVAAGKELYGWDFIYSDITWIRDSILVYFHLDPDTTVIVVDSE